MTNQTNGGPIWTLHYKSGLVVKHDTMLQALRYCNDGRRKCETFTHEPSESEIESAYAAESLHVS